MRSTSIFLLTSLLSLVVFKSADAQSSREDLIKQINIDIWYPFLKGVNENNPTLYNGILASDFYWVMTGTKTRIMNTREYIDDAAKVMTQRSEQKITTELSVRFLERNLNDELASEKCVIKWTTLEQDQNQVSNNSYRL